MIYKHHFKRLNNSFLEICCEFLIELPFNRNYYYLIITYDRLFAKSVFLARAKSVVYALHMLHALPKFAILKVHRCV